MIYKWLAKAGAIVAAVLGFFFMAKRQGRLEEQKDSLEALNEEQTEASQKLSKRQADELKAVEDAHSRPSRRDFD